MMSDQINSSFFSPNKICFSKLFNNPLNWFSDQNYNQEVKIRMSKHIYLLNLDRAKYLLLKAIINIINLF